MVGVYSLLFVIVDFDWLYFCPLQDVTENKNMPLMNLSTEKASLQQSQEDSNGVYEL